MLKADADWEWAVLGIAESALLADAAESPAGTDEPPWLVLGSEVATVLQVVVAVVVILAAPASELVVDAAALAVGVEEEA